MNTVWEIWNDVHNEPDSLKRIKSAALAENTPVSINKNNLTGTFQGSHGKYDTELDKCQCIDFSRRHKPCKHMYRLAFELGLFILEDTKSDNSKIKTPTPTPKKRQELFEKVINKLESYGDDIACCFKDMLYLHLYRDSLYPCEDVSFFSQPISEGLMHAVTDHVNTIKVHTKKSVVAKLDEIGFKFPEGIKTTQKARYEWCIENAEIIAPLIFSGFVFLEPAGDLLSTKRKVYSYLLKKFDSYNNFEVEE